MLKRHIVIPVVFLTLTAWSAAGHQHEDHGKSYTAKFTSLGSGPVSHYSGRPIHHHVGASDLESEVGLFEEVLPPKSLGAPPHTHSHEDAIFVVLKGKVNFLSGEEEVVAEAGTIASLPRNLIHGFWNPYDEPAQLLVFVAPGHFTEFFGAVEKAMSQVENKTPEAIGEVIAKEAAAIGVNVDMSKLPASAMALLQPPG